MITILDIRRAEAAGAVGDAQVAAALNAEPSRWSAEPLTLLAIADRLTLSLPGGQPAAEAYLDGLLTTLAADPSPATRAARDALASGREVVIGPAVRGKLLATFDATLLAPLLSLIRVGDDVTAADVAACRATHALAVATMGWIEDKRSADAVASAVIDADPLDADPAAVAAAYADALVAAVAARRANGGPR